MNTEAFRNILAALDALDIPDDDFQDLNAEFEDALMLLEETDPNDPEDLQESLETLNALRDSYTRWPKAAAIAAQLTAMIDG